MILARMIEPRLHQALAEFPAVALLGPRQSGKTTVAAGIGSQLAQPSVYLDLELPSDRAKLLADPELYLESHQHRLTVLDEVQRAPGIFQTLRALIDRRRRKGARSGQFLLLGSASLDLLQQSAESLAGRITYLELRPLLLPEVAASLGSGPGPASALDRLWVRGGFPDSLLAPSARASLRWRQAFLRTYLERDIPALGPRIPSETLRRFWQMLAHEQGHVLNAARLATALGVSGQTVTRYLDLLVDLMLARRLEPWAGNVSKRLVRAPKVYVRDSGLVHALLGLESKDDVLGHPVAGGSWEGFLLENILAAAPEDARACYYRTAAGAEIDLVLEFGAECWAIEFKRSMSDPHPSRGFHLACEDIGATRRLVVYAGADAYRLNPRTEVISLDGLLGTGFQPAAPPPRARRRRAAG